jgi:hypothetical protein
MFELFVGIDTARRRTESTLEARRPTTARGTGGTKHGPRRRDGVRSVSAAALRSLAERLEPSPSA